MKTFLFLLIVNSVNIWAQKTLSPNFTTLESKYIKDEISDMIWYAENGNQKIEIARVSTEMKHINKDELLIKTIVKMTQAPGAWTDSTTVKASDFIPVQHSSYNPARDMVLKFGNRNITGYYLDKKSQKKDQIDIAATGFYDSNSYPSLIRFLPLKEKYTAEISIFDYNPQAKKGMMKAYIQSVERMEYNGKKVWKVKTTDDISDKKTSVTFYIDRETRKLLKQDIEMKGQKMTMESV